MSLRHIWAVTVKELRYIQRDRATLFLVIFTPTMLLIMMAYAVTADIKHVPLGVLDLDRTPTSRTFVQQITLGESLDLYRQVDTMEDLETLLLKEEIHLALVIAPAFERELLSLRGMPLQVIVDGTEPQTGGYALDQILRRAESFATDLLSTQLAALGVDPEVFEPLNLSIRTWYNPNRKANVDIIPGLLSMVLGLPGMTVALTLAREREHGTFEQLLATPITRAELLLGKMGPYILSGIANVLITTAVAILWFKVPFNGNFPIFVLLSILFFFALLSMNMLVGVFIKTQAGAMAMSFLVVFFPGLFLTGVFFPVVSMPPIVRMEAMILPGSHYAIITRGVFITGIGLEILWPYAVAMFVFGLIFTGVAALFFRKKLA
jgi:ABC-type multidrug transport system permease subunit